MHDPPSKSTRFIVVCLFAVIYSFVVGFDILHRDGVVGTTLKNSGEGCVCHGIHVLDDSVHVWVEGPESVRIGSMNIYTLMLTGGPAAGGGFNLAVGHGTLSSEDTMTQLLPSPYNDGFELTHTASKSSLQDTVRWQFRYQSPMNASLDTIFSVGNSVNLNNNPDPGNPNGDAYNFGTNFIVHIMDTTLGVDDRYRPFTFQLLQNYPNPFNPVTTIQYLVNSALHGQAGSQHVNLKIFDLLGREVITVVNERKPAGQYTVSWNAGNLPSGIYIAQLKVKGAVQVKKMLLLR